MLGSVVGVGKIRPLITKSEILSGGICPRVDCEIFMSLFAHWIEESNSYNTSKKWNGNGLLALDLFKIANTLVAYW